MKNGLPRYYKCWNSSPGLNYFIYDRNTGKKIDECNTFDDAESRVKKLNAKDREERGLPPVNEVETPSHYFGSRNRNEYTIEPMPIYK